MVQRGNPIPSSDDQGTGTSYHCFDPVITGEVGNHLWIAASTTAPAPDGYFGLYTMNASARFRYVVIYGYEPSP